MLGARLLFNKSQRDEFGAGRLDAFYDPNERKYFITPQSVELAIKEEQAKANKDGGTQTAAQPEAFRKDSEKPHESDSGNGETKNFQQEIMDLKITNKGKDYFIEQLQKEREGFAQERRDDVEKLMTFNRKVGELETKLLQLEIPSRSSGSGMRSGSEAMGSERNSTLE